MNKSNFYQSASENMEPLGSVVPERLAEETSNALNKLKNALAGDVSGYVANRLHMSIDELHDALASEQVDGVALAMYNIEKRAQSVIIGDQTGIGKGRQAAAMIRYGLLSGYLPVFFTDRYTLFSDMYRDCKALGIKDARPLIVNAGASIVDFDNIIEEKRKDIPDEIWSPTGENDDDAKFESELMQLYQKQYEVVYKAPKKNILQTILTNGDISLDAYDYLMITYSQLKDAKRDATRLNFLHSLCEKHRVLFIFDEAHRSSSVSDGKISIITQGINRILTETSQTQCIFLSATFAKRPESLITFMRRTALSALANEDTLSEALHNGGVPMQEYVSSTLASEGQMIRREHSSEGIPSPIYTYLDDDLVIHGELFDKVMFFFREIAKLSTMVRDFVNLANTQGIMLGYKPYPALTQLFYINKVLLLSLKAQRVAQAAVNEVKQGRSVVIGMSDTLECILRDVTVHDDGSVRGDISSLLLRLLFKTVHSSNGSDDNKAVFDLIREYDTSEIMTLVSMADEIKDNYNYILSSIKDEIFHLPMSPIDVIRQLITREKFIAPDGSYINIRFEECTGRAHQLEYLSPDGNDDFVNAEMMSRKKRHSNHIFNDFQNNKLDVILINACGAIGASAHAISTAEVPEDQVRQRKMLIVQNDLDVNIDLQKRGRINRTGQRMDLPPLYEYIISAIPSEKRLNMMLRAKLRSLSANTAAWQDQDKEQADFIDINNKYGNEVATDYLSEHHELALALDLKGSVTATKLLARIAMLSVTAQQDIVDDLMAAYSTLESELRRINQWDLEREFRDFEAEFVREILFTTGKADTKLGGCSYLTTYKCKHKTFPYTYEALSNLCTEAKANFGKPYRENRSLQNQIRSYYTWRFNDVKEKYKERRTLLHNSAKRILVKYCGSDSLAETWLQNAQTPSEQWTPDLFQDVDPQKKSKQIMRKLLSFSNEYNHLLDREKREIKKYTAEKKRLVSVLAYAEIGKGYNNISNQLANDECPKKVIAVLRDIRFGKDDKHRFLPSQVELVFALTAVYTEIRINLVHNNKWSNYERLQEILYSDIWDHNAKEWDSEIAANNNKVVERTIITGNILGAFAHPAIAELKPRFITFSLKDNDKTQIGLLLPMDEAKIREAIKTISIPLNEGIKYATSTSTSYRISGIGVNFSLLPFRQFDNKVTFTVSVVDNNSKAFEADTRFDSIRQYFNGTPISSIYDKDESAHKKKKPLMHYQTDQLTFDSVAMQTIIQTLSLMDAVIVVPRDQITYGEAKEFASRSLINENEPWSVLDWKNADEIPMPPVKDKLLMRISAPVVRSQQNGKPVSKHSEHYLLAEETMALEGLPLNLISTLSSLRKAYMKWKNYYSHCSTHGNSTENGQPHLSEQRKICLDLRNTIENASKTSSVIFNEYVKRILQSILNREYLDTYGVYLAKFDEEMLFLSPDKAEAQAFLDGMPCSPRLEAIQKCVQDYIDGKTDIINSPDNW